MANETPHRRSRLPIAVFFVGIFAAGGDCFLQWYLDAFLYAADAGGRPPDLPLPSVLVSFETGIASAAVAALAGAVTRKARARRPRRRADGRDER